MPHTDLTEHQHRAPSVNRAMAEWLERQYDAPQGVNCGPEALAWDDHGLQGAGQPPTAALQAWGS
jgi:hypothetical protein